MPDKKIMIKGQNFSIQDLILTIPTKYEHKIFLEDGVEISSDLVYKFIFKMKSITKAKNKIIMTGNIENREFKIIHSLKLYKYFFSQDCFVFSGKFENDICFFPELLKTTTRTNEIVSIYKDFSPLIHKHIREGLVFFPQKLKEIFEIIHFPKEISQVKKALKELFIFELSIFFEIIEKLQKPKIPFKIHDVKIPFELTNDQKSIWEEIKNDLQNS
ncbi:MAG: hypothetical protein ACK5XN_27460, partial [Bacteroidota bacterium]